MTMNAKEFCSLIYKITTIIKILVTTLYTELVSIEVEELSAVDIWLRPDEVAASLAAVDSADSGVTHMTGEVAGTEDDATTVSAALTAGPSDNVIGGGVVVAVELVVETVVVVTVIAGGEEASLDATVLRATVDGLVVAGEGVEEVKVGGMAVVLLFEELKKLKVEVVPVEAPPKKDAPPEVAPNVDPPVMPKTPPDVVLPNKPFVWGDALNLAALSPDLLAAAKL